MDDEDKDRLVRLYEHRFETQGASIKTLGWNGPEDQTLRFSVLGDIAELTDTSVCDVGCGFGDLLPYLQTRFGDVRYTGIDLVPSLVAEAARRHPKGRYLCLDLLEEPFEERFDYLLLSGALNFRIKDNWDHTRALVRRMFDMCNRGVAVNFLTSYVNFERDYNFHHRPEDVLTFAKGLTRWVSLRHDYPLWEFTIFLYKTPLIASMSE